MVIVWWSAAHLIHYSFLNLGETITSEKYAQQIDEMPENCMPAAGIAQQKGPSAAQQRSTACHKTSASKVERIGLQSFASSGTFTWPLANWLALEDLDNLLQRKGFHNQEEAENSFQEFVESQSLGF